MKLNLDAFADCAEKIAARGRIGGRREAHDEWLKAQAGIEEAQKTSDLALNGDCGA
jgi:hypothetical protein